MGCDIHLYKEKRVNGTWVTADAGWSSKGNCCSDVPWEDRFTDRNYKLFGILSKGVRYECPLSLEGRGLPVDTCPQVTAIYQDWGSDVHSASHISLSELVELKTKLETSMITVSGMKDASQLAALHASIESGSSDWGLIYPYCSWANDDAYVEFSIEVPASFITGDSLDKIISSFEGIDCEDHRIVFCFDN